MADTTRLTIPVAYNVRGSRPGGLNLDDEPIGFQGQYSPYMLNMVVTETRLKKRQGYQRVGTGAAMSGIGMDLVTYSDAVGDTHLIALTSTKAYQYNSTTDAWDNITEFVADADVDWAGDADDRFSSVVATDAAVFTTNGGSALCVVNNVDDVKYFEGLAGSKFATLLHEFPSFSTCACISEFWNHLMLLGYTDTAKRARSLGFSASGDLTDWTGPTAGATTLTDTLGSIIRAEKLGYDLAVYSDNTVSRCQYIGGSTLFTIPALYQDVGLFTFGSLCNYGPAHFFLGSDQQVYSLLQGFTLQNIGKGVCKRLFSNISWDNKLKVSSGFDKGRQKALFAIPTAGETYSKRVYAVNVGMDGNPWELHDFGHDVRAIATLKRKKSSAYCDDTEWADVYCDETAAYCDDLYGQEGADLTCFLTSDGYVYALDETSGYDGDRNISCEYQTEDITFDEEDFFRTLWFSFVGRSAFPSSQVYVYSSVDGGETWDTIVDSPVTLDDSWETYRLPLDVTARRIRFRLTQSGFGDMQLRGNFKIEIKPASSRD